MSWSTHETAVIDVVFLVLPDTLLLDLAGPAEAFRLANQALHRRGRAPAFRMRHIGPRPQTASSVGLMLGGLEPLPAGFDPAQPTWLVLLDRPGEVGEVVGATPDWLAARDWLGRVVAPRLTPPGTPAGALKLLTVCSGALLAADAGLLAGRQATTHHELLDGLRRLAPAAKVLANRVFVDDGAVLTSAGITAGIDLALHLGASGASLAKCPLWSPVIAPTAAERHWLRSQWCKTTHDYDPAARATFGIPKSPVIYRRENY